MKKPIHLPKIELSRLRKYFIYIFSAVVIFTGGYFLGVKGYSVKIKKLSEITVSRQIPPDKSDLDFSLFWRVWDNLSARYFDKGKLNSAQMIYGAIQGMVSSLGDPYTVFLPPSENKVVQEDLSGSFEGTGIQIGFKGLQLAVIAPLPGSPADKAGIKAGDYIIAIKDDGKSIDRGTEGLSLPEAVQMIRGKAGTKVTLTLLRNGTDKPLVIELTREKINVPSIILSYVGEGDSIAHLRLLKFGSETESEWNKAVREILKNKNVTSLILDLRSNPGGYLQGAVDIASEFLSNGSTVVIEETGNGVRNEFKVERFGLLVNTPLVVLVDGGSASASEILAGALRDQRKIKIIGEKSFGKGTIQEPQELENGSGLHITIAKWLTPNETWVNEKGLEPDIKVEDNPVTPDDEVLLEAIKQLSAKQ